MANQHNPNIYSLMCRCPLRDAAKLRTKANSKGVPLSAYVADLVRADVGTSLLSDDEKQWVSKRLEANIEKRKKADEKTSEGYYRKKNVKRGRPRKKRRTSLTSASTVGK